MTLKNKKFTTAGVEKRQNVLCTSQDLTVILTDKTRKIDSFYRSKKSIP